MDIDLAGSIPPVLPHLARLKLFPTVNRPITYVYLEPIIENLAKVIVAGLSLAEKFQSFRNSWNQGALVGKIVNEIISCISRELIVSRYKLRERDHREMYSCFNGPF